MRNCEIDGSTAYVAIDAAGIGATVDAALAADSSGQVRHVAVCGPRPGAGKTGAEAWAAQLGRWLPVAQPHVTRSALRAGLVADGRRVHVSRIEPWFGEHVEPEHAAEAMRYVRHVAGVVGVRPVGTPGATGRLMLGAMWARSSSSWAELPAELRELLRSTSGQGRFQVFPAGAAGGAELVSVDARFQYGALAALELPVGVPADIAGEPDDEYAPSWCQLDFVPAGPLAMLPVKYGAHWSWPTDGGPYRTWASGAEVQAARRAGYQVTVLRSIVWPAKARPLAPWARLISKHRARVDTLPLADGVKAAARAGLRSIVVQTIGQLHGGGASPVPFASANETGGAPPSFDRPEWSTAIYAMARARLAQVMSKQTAPLVACSLDGFHVAGEPVLSVDDGADGRWRVVARYQDWQPVRNMADLYGLKP